MEGFNSPPSYWTLISGTSPTTLLNYNSIPMARRTRSRKNNPVAKHAVHPIEAEIAQVKDDLQAQLAIATPLPEVEAVKKIVEPVKIQAPKVSKAKEVSVEPIQEITEKSLKADIIDEACVIQAEDAKTIDDLRIVGNEKLALEISSSNLFDYPSIVVGICSILAIVFMVEQKSASANVVSPDPSGVIKCAKVFKKVTPSSD